MATASSCSPNKPAKYRGRAKEKRTAAPTNPLQAGILSFLTRSGGGCKTDADTTHPGIPVLTSDDLPKRFTLYSPALLLPGNFAQHSQPWTAVYENLDNEARQELFASIAETFRCRGKHVTHIAITAAIPSTVGPQDQDNRLRSPCQLLPVYGDFGPAFIHQSTGTAASGGNPTQVDFDAAFWLSTCQDAGINQVWAPRWTMFSRGNIREKARILRHGGDHEFPGMTEKELGTPIAEAEVLDMYVGIGYFAFSYLKSGVKRVWGWDLNPWSIEGLRRGCEQNGWRHLIVQIAQSSRQSPAQEQAPSNPAEHASQGPQDQWPRPHCEIDMKPDARAVASIIAESDKGPATDRVRCVAFLGSNEWAAVAIRNIAAHLQVLNGCKAPNTTGQPSADEISPVISIRHVNLGLLPSSHDSWKTAVSVVSKDLASWLHVHENVNAKAIRCRAEDVASEVNSIACGTRGKRNWRTSCDHIEQVKSFGPGVVHCVFDISITPTESTAAS